MSTDILSQGRRVSELYFGHDPKVTFLQGFPSRKIENTVLSSELNVPSMFQGPVRGEECPPNLHPLCSGPGDPPTEE